MDGWNASNACALTRDVSEEEPSAEKAGGASASRVPRVPGDPANASAATLFATSDERDEACAELGTAGMVVVELEGIGPSARGRLADAIDEAIERALGARGAAAPGIASNSDRDATLSNQLFRARRVGATGIAIVLGPLNAAVGPCGALEPEDCATLSFLAHAALERPLALMLDARDEQTAGYGAPISLRALLTRERPHEPEERAEPAAAALAGAPADAPTPAATPPLPGAPVAAPLVASPPAPAIVPGASASPAVRPLGVESDEAWRTWTLQLTAARGPQPLAALERLFSESYMPLNHAIASGLDDSRARHAHDEFAAAFAKGYTEAFTMFAATTKRPRLVLDAHDVAARIARLHGARSTRLLLVDGMRWDVSRLVQERLAAKLGARASITDELLLWSALPTTTMRQLETIARGVEALRAPAPLDGEPEPPRGRTAEYVRRMRVGPRELSKLDLLEARVQAARAHVLEEMADIALATAEAIARHVDTLQARTLLFVFGDHGFTLDRSGIARQGGASPEEVLVGAFALLVGDVH